METVTPVSSNDAQRLQQEIMSEASRAFQILLEVLRNELKKGLGKPKETEKETLKDKGEIIIGGKEKDPNQLTWEDYGKLQALSQKDVGDNHPDLANIKVRQITNGKEQTLLETNAQGTVLTNRLKPPSLPNLTASQAVNQALNQLADSPVKDYLVTVNQQLTQQLQQQQQILQESQKINLEQAKLLHKYQQLQSLRDKKEPQWWSKAATQFQNKVGQTWTSLNQWWQEKNQQLQRQNNYQHLAGNLRYFAKEIMKTSQLDNLSGDKYDLEKKGDTYQLKSKQGSVLMKFQDKGVLGTKVLESNLTPEQQQDINQLANFRKDRLFLLKNSQFFSNQSSPPISNSPTQSSQALQELQTDKDYNYILRGLKYLVEQRGIDLDKKNIEGFDIQTKNQGQTILIARSNGGDLVVSQSQTGRQIIPTTSTQTDAQKLKQIVDKALNRLQRQSSHSPPHGAQNQVQPLEVKVPQLISPPQQTPLMVNEFSRQFLEPKWSNKVDQYVTTGFDQEIGHTSGDVPDEITLAVHNHLFRINDNYPPNSGEITLMARELDNYSILAVANSAMDDRGRPLVNYRYFWLDNQKDNPNFDGIATLLNWWEENGQPSPKVEATSHILANLEENQKTNFYQISQIQEKTQKPSLSREQILSYEQDDVFSNNYQNLHDLASRQSEPHERISWAWNVTKLEEPDQFSVVQSPQTSLYFPAKSKQRNFPTNPQEYQQQFNALKNDFQMVFKNLQDISTRMNRPLNGTYHDYKIETKKNGHIKIYRKSDPFVKLADYNNEETSLTKYATNYDVKQLTEMINLAKKSLTHQTLQKKGKSR